MTSWFDVKHLEIKNIIKINDLHGYVLPHAGTSFTGNIISHTLRFRPITPIKKVIILYYPASTTPDIDNTYFHEYYVPWKSIDTIFNDKQITYEGYNIANSKHIKIIKNLNLTSDTISNTIIVVSADFSHFLSFQKAINLENKAAHALMFKEELYENVVDDMKTFKVLYDTIPNHWILQWIGRDRSIGQKAVGYLSFLLREMTYPKNDIKKPDGMFVTAFSNNMVTRECLGEWFDNKKLKQKWNQTIENNLINKVIKLGETTSRLTNGSNLEKPLVHYTITYLYKDTKHSFIRGWHGTLHNAFYLPDVFLENTFNNGTWINNNHTTWQKGSVFKLNDTIKQLNLKAGVNGGGRKKRKTKYNRLYKQKRKFTHKLYGGNHKNGIILYSSRVAYYKNSN